MIIISKLEDLEKYRDIMPANKNDGKHKKVVYNFIENDKQADVLFDLAIDLTYECQKANKDDYECCVYVKAKSITLNYSFTCNKIFTDNLSIKDWCNCDFVLIHKSITGNNLKCENINCLSSIDCQNIYTRQLQCKSIKAKLLNIENKIVFNDINSNKIEFKN